VTPPALAAYLALSRLGGPAAPALLRRRLARGREDGARLDERLGRAGRPRPPGRLAWVHAASVGEAVSAVPLVRALGARGLQVLVTTGTVTSARRMAAALPDGAVHQFAPVDTGGAVRGFLDHWRPDLAVWIESELWPRLVVETARRGVRFGMFKG
jgi:3-deoxy-D-manno-octulosonic-acid transferase